MEKSGVSRRNYRVALNFCGSLVLRMGDFLCFEGNNFAIEKNWFFLLGINFCYFQEVAFYLDITFLFFEYK